MLGAIVGDVVGSAHEHRPVQERDFPLFTRTSSFTDDTVLTTAVASAILEARGAADGTTSSPGEPDYALAILTFARQWPRAGYGGDFRAWMRSAHPQPYGSWGNGSAMRVSPIGFAFNDIDTVLREAARSAAVTHDHPEGIKGAQAVALGVFLARQRATKAEIRKTITQRFGYDLDRTVEAIRPHYSFDVSCQGSVPEAIVAFLESEDVESAIRNAVWLGGDADTQACIAGALAQAFYGVIPENIERETRSRLPEEIVRVVDEFSRVLGV